MTYHVNDEQVVEPCGFDLFLSSMRRLTPEALEEHDDKPIIETVYSCFCCGDKGPAYAEPLYGKNQRQWCWGKWFCLTCWDKAMLIIRRERPVARLTINRVIDL